MQTSHNFHVTTKFEAIEGVEVSKFRSNKSGLSVVHVDVEGPIVEGAFALATEAHDDDGCPHTLEHLIFLGSELYPYKGILDGVANRCLAQGTNAWTDTDHTAYTLSTAGSEGFLNMLPVYLDHILYPTITDSAFHTEVHHITGEGEDAGVVYCEMQGRENSSLSRVYRAMLLNMYPNCGYSAETGGIMSNLRDLKVEKVRNYHKQFYRSDNLCLIVSGKIDENELFAKLQPFEERIISKGSLLPMTRPWSTPVPPLSGSVTQSILFPSDDEETGMVMMAWRGPKYEEFETILALKTLWAYLTDSAVSPFCQALTEIEDPYCTEITNGMIGASEYCQYVIFSNSPTEKLTEIRPVIMNILKKLVKGGLDMQRMTDTIHKKIRDFYDQFESSPHRVIQTTVIGHFLYGKDDSELQRDFSEVKFLQLLLEKKNEYWANLIQKILIDSYYVEIQGKPSKQFGQELQDKEKERIERQRKSLGEENLKQLAELLENASKKNDIPVPDSIFQQFKIPDPSKIPFFTIQTLRNDEIVSQNPSQKSPFESIISDKENKLPFWIQFDHVSSFFLQLRVILDTVNIPETLKLYVELFLEIIFKLPIERNGKLINHEEVITELERDTVSYSNSLGAYGSTNFNCGGFAHLLFLEMKFENSKYEKAIQWVHEILWKTQFNVERLKVGVAKLLNDIPQHLRKGESMVRFAIRTINFTRNSNHRITNAIRQQQFLNGLAKRLEDPEEASKVVQEIEEFRNFLCHPNHLRIQVIANISNLGTKPKKVWKNFLPPIYNENYVSTVAPIHYSTEWLSKESLEGNHGYIMGLASIESQFFVQTAPALSDFGHKDEAAVLIFIEYLTQAEGLFWKKIRGNGYAYGYAIRQSIDEGMLSFFLIKSTNVFKAFQVSKEIVNGINRIQDIDYVKYEGSVSGTVFEIVSREENIQHAAFQSFLNYYRQVGPNGNKNLLNQLSQVTLDDLIQVLNKYFKPLFDIKKSNVAIASNPSKVQEMVESFSTANRTLMHIDSLETFFN